MRIVCPSCSVAYDVPDSLITAGRTVRCAHCSGEWTPVPATAAGTEPAPQPIGDPTASIPDVPVTATAPEGSAAEPVPAAEAPSPRSSAMDRLAMPSARPPSRLWLRLAWLSSLALLVFLGWAGYAWRAQIVEVWPPSARVYAAFGIQLVPDRTQ
jgi:predicted Zn finger-like uncharacterized protein